MRATTTATRTRRARTRATATNAPKPRTRRRSQNLQREGINRDALLRSLFPNGIPAREDAIRQVNAWLDEAQRLARMR